MVWTSSYHHAELGEAGTSFRTLRGRKSSMFLFPIFAHHALNDGFCDFVMKQLKYRNSFDIADVSLYTPLGIYMAPP